MTLFGPNNHSKFKINWRPVTPELVSELKTILATVYNLSEIEDILQVDEWERMSNNFRINTQVNGHPTFFLLRKNIQIRDPEHLFLIQEILAYLTTHGLVVPHNIPDQGGNYWSGIAGHHYQLFNFIAGDHYRGTLVELGDSGERLAQLHQLFATLPETLLKKITARPLLLPPWEHAGWEEMMKRARHGESPYDRQLVACEPLVTSSIRAIDNADLSEQDSVWQPIHGDFHPQNTLYRDECCQAILDFENVRWGERARDLANAGHRFVRQYIVHRGGDWRELLPEGFRLFLRRYRQLGTVSDEELLTLPLFIFDELLRKLYKDVGSYYRTGETRTIENGELEKKLTLLAEAEQINVLFNEGRLVTTL